MRRITTSVCLTVFNEEDSIEELLASLLHQTLKPTEIVICDGGSTDRTVQIVKKFQSNYLYGSRIRVRDDDRVPQIKLVISHGNVAHGRNTAIAHAKGEIILCIDAGCRAKKDWVKKLTEPFYLYRSRIKSGMTMTINSGSKPGMTNGIVGGFYEMKWRTPFQKVMALYRGTHPKRYDQKTFIPSCRSVAFKKEVWVKLKGFDESLSLSGEDTDFFYRAVKAGYTIKNKKDALVYWNEPMRFSFKDIKKFFYYAKGDAQTNIWWDPVKKWKTHNIKILTIYLRYLFLLVTPYIVYHLSVNWIPASAGMTKEVAGMTAFLFIVLCLLLYCLWSIWKWRDSIVSWKERLWIPVVQIGTDVMVMSGFLVGLLSQKLQMK